MKKSLPITFAKNVFVALKKRASSMPPDLSRPGGDLFILPNMPIAGIRLKISAEEYFKQLNQVEGMRECRFQVAPTEDKEFAVIISGSVTVRDGKIFINNEESPILF